MRTRIASFLVLAGLAAACSPFGWSHRSQMTLDIDEFATIHHEGAERMRIENIGRGKLEVTLVAEDGTDLDRVTVQSGATHTFEVAPVDHTLVRHPDAGTGRLGIALMGNRSIELRAVVDQP